jgi:uncharacterized protein YdaU (DUF1376 family)
MKWYARNVGDYLGATLHLTFEEDGAYSRLLDAAYATERALPASASALHRVCRARTDAECAAVDRVIAQFFILTDAGYTHPKVEQELEKAGAISDKRRLAASARWGENAQAGRADRVREAKAKGTHTEAEWAALLATFGFCCVKCGASGEGVELTKDHIHPIAKGGNDAISNLQPMCQKCNSSRSGDVADFRASAMQRLSISNANAHTTTTTTTGVSTKANAFVVPKENGGVPVDRSSTTTTVPTKRVRARALPPAVVDPAPGAETWAAYSKAYFARYHTDPVRNAKTNRLIANVVERLGANDAPHVAAFYVASSRGLYVSATHAVDLLVRDCEALRTQWANGTATTETEARQVDKTAAAGNAFDHARKEIRNGTTG